MKASDVTKRQAVIHATDGWWPVARIAKPWSKTEARRKRTHHAGAPQMLMGAAPSSMPALATDEMKPTTVSAARVRANGTVRTMTKLTKRFSNAISSTRRRSPRRASR
jgi:hypothetical protein